MAAVFAPRSSWGTPSGESSRGGVVAPATSPPFAAGSADTSAIKSRARREKRGSSSNENSYGSASATGKAGDACRTGARQDAGGANPVVAEHTLESLVGRGESMPTAFAPPKLVRASTQLEDLNLRSSLRCVLGESGAKANYDREFAAIAIEIVRASTVDVS